MTLVTVAPVQFTHSVEGERAPVFVGSIVQIEGRGAVRSRRVGLAHVHVSTPTSYPPDLRGGGTSSPV
jgi:hypothetical protein